MAGLNDAVRAALAAAPDLVQTPGLAAGIAQTGATGQINPFATAQIASLTQTALGIKQSQSLNPDEAPAAPTGAPDALVNAEPTHHSLFGSLMGDVGHAVKDVVDNPITRDVGDAVGMTGHAINEVTGGQAGKVTADTGHALGDVASVLGQPEGQVQHYYRAVHDIFTRYGTIKGVESILPALLMGPGQVYAQSEVDDAAQHMGMGNQVAKQWGTSWQVTQDGTNYRDKYGNAVNPGFDLANVVDHVANGHGYMPTGWTRNEQGQMVKTAAGGVDFTTGLVNAVFDLGTDPTLKLGGIGEAAKARGIVLGAKEIALGDDSVKASEKLAELKAAGAPFRLSDDGKSAMVGGRVLYAQRIPRLLVNPDGTAANDIRYIAQTNPGVRDAFGALAGMNKSADIINSYPMLTPMASDLAKANSVEDVAGVFEHNINIRNYSYHDRGLPTTSLTRRGLANVGIHTPTGAAARSWFRTPTSRVVMDANGEPAVSSVTGEVLTKAGKVSRANKSAGTYRAWAIGEKAKDISGSAFDPLGDDAGEIVRRTFSEIHDDRTARALAGAFVSAPEEGTRVNIWKNGLRDMYRAAGLPDDHPWMQPLDDDAHFLTKEATTGGLYGIDDDAKEIRFEDPATGSPTAAGLLESQRGKLSVPNFNELRKQVAQVKQAAAIEGKTGGFLPPQLKRILPDVLRGGPSSVLVRGDDWLYNHYTAPIFKNLSLLSLGFALRVGTAELIPSILKYGSKEVFGSGLMAHAARLNPSLRDLADEHAGRWIPKDVLAATKDGRKGVLKEVGRKTSKVEIDGKLESHATDSLDALTKPPSEDKIREIAEEHGVTPSKDEIPHYKAAISKALYGVGRALVDPDHYDAAVRNIIATDGHLVPGSVASMHDTPITHGGGVDDVTHYMQQGVARKSTNKGREVLGSNFQPWNSGDDHHPMFWNFAINEASKDRGVAKGAQAYLAAVRGGAEKDAATQAFRDADKEWIESDEGEKFRNSMRIAGQPTDVATEKRAALMRGLVYGDSGKLNQDVLESIAGELDVPGISDLANKELVDRPKFVKGRTIDTVMPPMWPEKMSQWGWRKALHPTINNMSRAPIYTMLTTQEYKFYKPWVDAGLMTKAEAHGFAMERAAHRMLPLIHNTKLRSQMSDIFRNVLPFYFAQEQSYKRYGRAVFSDATSFRRGLLAEHAVRNSGAIQGNGSENSVVMPGGTEYAKLATSGAAALGMNVLGGIPSTISGNTLSLKSAIPEGNLPSLSPLVAVALKEIQNRVPAGEPFISPVIGDITENESALDSLIPSATLKRLLQTTPLLDRETAFTTSYMNNVAWAFHESEVTRQQAQTAYSKGNRAKATSLFAKANEFMPDQNATPMQKQAALDRIKNATRIQMLMKTAIGVVSPLSPVMATGDIKLRAEVQADMTKYGYTNGLNKFLAANPDATADTVFLSDSDYTGASLPATKSALDWVQNNLAFTKKHPLAAAYLIPQTKGAFDVQAYNEETATGLRVRKSPQQLVTALYAAAVDPDYYKSLDIYEKAKAQAQATGDTAKLNDLYTSWNSYYTSLAQANPVWNASQNDPNKAQTAQLALAELKRTLSSGTAPASPQTAGLQDLISSWGNYQMQQAQISNGSSSLTASQAKDNYQSYLNSEASQNPALSSAITGIFRRLLDVGE